MVKSIMKIFDCYTIATLTHYFYLTFFTWSNTMAYDLFSTLKQLDPKSSKSSGASRLHSSNEASARRRFAIYSLYSWSAPFLLVALLTAKQFIIDSAYPRVISYGYRACWISSTVDQTLFFVLPVAVLLIINLYFLIACIMMIRLVDKSTGKYLNRDESGSTSEDHKKRLILFIKLFCLTGMI